MVLTAAFMGAEYDEAWIVASARQAFDANALPSVAPVTTSGGLHFLIIGVTHGLPISPLAVPRLMSLMSVVSLYIVILRTLRPMLHTSIEYRLLAVTCIAAPGTVLLSGMGYAVVMAMSLFLSGILVVLRNERISLQAAVIAGVLVGCAIANRWTLLPAVPALALCAFVSRTHLWRNLCMCMLAGGVMVAVFLGLLFLQMHLMEGTGPSGSVSLSQNLGSAGVGRGLPSPARMYSFVVRFVTTLPVVLIFLAVAALLAWRLKTQVGRIIMVLLAAALLVTGAWIVKSPFMHLRYIWPAYMMVALCAGFALVALYRLAENLNRKEMGLAIVCFTALLCLSQLVVATRVIAIGAAMQINAGGYANLENHFKSFYHIQEQQAIVRYLKSMPPDTRVGMIGTPPEFGAIELALLSNRRVFDFASSNMLGYEGTPDIILTHRFSPFNDAGIKWVEMLGDPAMRIFGYSVYTYSSSEPLPSPQDVLIDAQLHRFSLERSVSLTGS